MSFTPILWFDYSGNNEQQPLALTPRANTNTLQWYYNVDTPLWVNAFPTATTLTVFKDELTLNSEYCVTSYYTSGWPDAAWALAAVREQWYVSGSYYRAIRGYYGCGLCTDDGELSGLPSSITCTDENYKYVALLLCTPDFSRNGICYFLSGNSLTYPQLSSNWHNIS